MALLGPSDIFADVGANLGYYTVMLSPLVKKIVAFEPVKMSYDYCKTNIELNHRNNVVLHNLGLWHLETDLEMTVDRSSLMTSHIGKGETVHCVTLGSTRHPADRDQNRHRGSRGTCPRGNEKDPGIVSSDRGYGAQPPGFGEIRRGYR